MRAERWKSTTNADALWGEHQGAERGAMARTADDEGRERKVGCDGSRLPPADLVRALRASRWGLDLVRQAENTLDRNANVAENRRTTPLVARAIT